MAKYAVFDFGDVASNIVACESGIFASGNPSIMAESIHDLTMEIA